MAGYWRRFRWRQDRSIRVNGSEWLISVDAVDL
jgi:hypothetical protein